MARTDRACVLSMRVAREQARLDDLGLLLPYAVPGRDAVRERLDTALRACRTKLADQTASPADLAGLPQSAGEAGDLVDEVVALLLARLLREHGLDSGAFDAAEALLGEFTALARVPAVTLGQAQDCERADSTRNRIDVRFPGARIWEVPFLAHEFGHHATAHLPHYRADLAARRPLLECARDPLRNNLASADSPDRYAEAHADELIADAVATVCCGPAYVVATLCLRVPQGEEVSLSTSTHPPWRDRVATMRAALDALSEQTERPRYAWQREHLVDPLAVTVLGRPPDASRACREAATGTVQVLHRHCPQLVYQDGDAAIGVKNRLERGEEKLLRDVSVAAILDGGWQWRLERATRGGDDAAEKLLVGYCREIVRGGRHGRR